MRKERQWRRVMAGAIVSASVLPAYAVPAPDGKTDAAKAACKRYL